MFNRSRRWRWFLLFFFASLPFLSTEGLFHCIKVVYDTKTTYSSARAVWKTDYVFLHLLLMLLSLIWFSVRATFSREQIILLLKVLQAFRHFIPSTVPTSFVFDSCIFHPAQAWCSTAGRFVRFYWEMLLHTWKSKNSFKLHKGALMKPRQLQDLGA